MHNFSSITGDNTVEIDGELKKLENLGAMIGEDCNFGSHVVIDPGIIIGRKCNIESMKKITKEVPSNTKVM